MKDKDYCFLNEGADAIYPDTLNSNATIKREEIGKYDA